MYGKMAAAFGVCAIGGPALIIWVSPSEEELFLKYNPELQKRSLENRKGKQEDFDHFVNKLKEYSKSDKPIWEAAAEDERNQRDGKIAEQVKLVEEIRRRKEEIRKSGTSDIPGSSL
ncbi:putative Assembly factor cbp4 [Glarea lozoyensis 74030]|nr:putative Assembly factor cbp4 [Glarea lozoyensis 74030]